MKKREISVWILLRLTLGWIFLWAFFDKLFGLGFATKSDKSWLLGNSPTTGFLKAAARGPFENFFHSLAGYPLIDYIFMAGLLLIGLSLMLGIMTKIASYSGALMMVLMWSALLPPENNPFLDEHIVYIIVLIGISLDKSVHGFGNKWNRLKLVKDYPILK